MPAGRPRSESARLAILEATRAELAERGFDRLSIDRIAAAAGVSKPTVYRWYPSKNALVADCLLQGYVMTPAINAEDHGDIASDVIEWMRRFSEITQDPQAVKLIRAAAAAGTEDPEIARAFQQQMSTMARDGLSARLERGHAAGQLRPDVQSTVVAEIIVGALLYRLVTHEKLTEEFVRHLAETILSGIVR